MEHHPGVVLMKTPGWNAVFCHFGSWVRLTCFSLQPFWRVGLFAHFRFSAILTVRSLAQEGLAWG
jgi:hypothetical protein